MLSCDELFFVQFILIQENFQFVNLQFQLKVIIIVVYFSIYSKSVMDFNYVCDRKDASFVNFLSGKRYFSDHQ